MVYFIDPDYVLLKNIEDRVGRKFETRTFLTSSDMLKSLGEQMPACIVLEVALPEHNGLELLYEILSFTDTRRIKVFIYTSLHEMAFRWGVMQPKDLQIERIFYKSHTDVDQLVRAIGENI